jgi:hypothetical protein
VRTADLRRQLIVRHRGPHTLDLVGRDAHPDARAADQETQVRPAVRDGLAHLSRRLGIVHHLAADIANEFARALALENGEREAALERLNKRLPEVLKQLNEDPVAAKVFEGVMAESFAEGLAEVRR